MIMAVGYWLAGTSVLGLGLIAFPAPAAQIRVGSLLVATAKSQDPDFAGATIVLIHFDRDSAMGLMLNRPTKIPIGDVLSEAKGKPVVVYAGGPVAIGLRGLVRTESAPFFRVVTAKAELLLIANGAGPNSFRIYVGYVGWTRRQLQNEIARGLWKVMPSDQRAIFGEQH